jgi:hypothetical protein
MDLYHCDSGVGKLQGPQTSLRSVMLAFKSEAVWMILRQVSILSVLIMLLHRGQVVTI